MRDIPPRQVAVLATMQPDEWVTAANVVARSRWFDRYSAPPENGAYSALKDLEKRGLVRSRWVPRKGGGTGRSLVLEFTRRKP